MNSSLTEMLKEVIAGIKRSKNFYKKREAMGALTILLVQS